MMTDQQILDCVAAMHSAGDDQLVLIDLGTLRRIAREVERWAERNGDRLGEQ